MRKIHQFSLASLLGAMLVIALFFAFAANWLREVRSQSAFVELQNLGFDILDENPNCLIYSDSKPLEISSDMVPNIESLTNIDEIVCGNAVISDSLQKRLAELGINVQTEQEGGEKGGEMTVLHDD